MEPKVSLLHSQVPSTCPQSQLSFIILYCIVLYYIILYYIMFYVLYILLYYIVWEQIRNTWKVLKCGSGEWWRRSFEPIMWEMKKFYLE